MFGVFEIHRSIGTILKILKVIKGRIIDFSNSHFKMSCLVFVLEIHFISEYKYHNLVVQYMKRVYMVVVPLGPIWLTVIGGGLKRVKQALSKMPLTIDARD